MHVTVYEVSVPGIKLKAGNFQLDKLKLIWNIHIIFQLHVSCANFFFCK